MKKIAFLILLFSVVWGVAWETQPARMWKSRNGSEVEAMLVEDDGKRVILRSIKGAKLAISRDMLSTEDVSYLDQILREEQKKRREKEEKERRLMFRPSGMSVAEFHATRPTGVVVFLAKASLSDYFNYEFISDEAERIYWSVDLDTMRGVQIGHGYILKDGRGKELFELLRDGKKHPVKVRVRYPEGSDSSGVFFLDDYQEVSDE